MSCDALGDDPGRPGAAASDRDGIVAVDAVAFFVDGAAASVAPASPAASPAEHEASQRTLGQKRIARGNSWGRIESPTWTPGPARGQGPAAGHGTHPDRNGRLSSIIVTAGRRLPRRGSGAAPRRRPLRRAPDRAPAGEVARGRGARVLRLGPAPALADPPQQPSSAPHDRHDRGRQRQDGRDCCRRRGRGRACCTPPRRRR